MIKKITLFLENIIFYGGWCIFFYCITTRQTLPFLSSEDGEKIDHFFDIGAFLCFLLGLLYFSCLAPKFHNEDIKNKATYIALSTLFIPIWQTASDLLSGLIYHL